MDPHVFAAESCVVPPYDDHWMPFTWNIPNNCNFDLFASPVQKPATAEGVYASTLYSILSKNSDHINIVNPSPRPIKFYKEEVIMTMSPFTVNTPYSYINISLYSLTVDVTAQTLSPGLSIHPTFIPPCMATFHNLVPEVQTRRMNA